MKIIEQGDAFFLEKNGAQIGQCQVVQCAVDRLAAKDAAPTAHNVQGAYHIVQFEISPQWQRKGYGSFLLKDLLKRTGGYDAKRATTYRVDLPNTPFPTAFFAKFGFVPSADGIALVRRKTPDLTAITLVQRQVHLHLGQLAQHGITAPLCIDATCGNGHDSLFLAGLLGAAGHLLALDLQPEAIAQTKQRLQAADIPATQYTLHCADHATLAQYAAPCSADVIVFNFGWLPGADHDVFSSAGSSIPALAAALELLKPGGLLCATLYSGEGIGDAEKTAILHWLQALPITQYTVLTCNFANWADTAPLPCFIFKK